MNTIKTIKTIDDADTLLALPLLAREQVRVLEIIGFEVEYNIDEEMYAVTYRLERPGCTDAAWTNTYRAVNFIAEDVVKHLVQNTRAVTIFEMDKKYNAGKLAVESNSIPLKPSAANVPMPLINRGIRDLPNCAKPTIPIADKDADAQKEPFEASLRPIKVNVPMPAVRPIKEEVVKCHSEEGRAKDSLWRIRLSDSWIVDISFSENGSISSVEWDTKPSLAKLFTSKERDNILKMGNFPHCELEAEKC
jgi:hypothetical protein